MLNKIDSIPVILSIISCKEMPNEVRGDVHGPDLCMDQVGMISKRI